MKSLLSIIERNIRIFARSKISTFIVLIAPIILVILVGTAFSSDSLSNVRLGVYSSSYNELSNSIISGFEGKEFTIERIDSEESCVNSLKEGDVQACIIFPGDLSAEGNSQPVSFYVDNSRVNLAYSLINEVNTKISAKGSELGVAMVEILVGALEKARESLPIQKTDVDSSINSAYYIKSSANEALSSGSSISSAIGDVASASAKIDAINDSGLSESTKTELKKIMKGLTLVNNSYNSLSGSLKTIENKTVAVDAILVSLSGEIDALILEINNVKISDAEKVVSPIKTQINTISKESSNWAHLFPTLTALVILLSSIILASSLVLAEKNARAHFRNFLTPTSDLTFIIGTYLTALLVLAVQLSILFTGTIYFTKLNLSGILPQIALVLFVSCSAFIFMGMLIGYMFKSEQTSLLASISIASLLIFFSNTIFPTEAIIGSLRYGAMFNPLFITDALLKKLFLFKANIGSLTFELLTIAGIFALLFVFTYAARKITKKSA